MNVIQFKVVQRVKAEEVKRTRRSGSGRKKMKLLNLKKMSSKKIGKKFEVKS